MSPARMRAKCIKKLEATSRACRGNTSNTSRALPKASSSFQFLCCLISSPWTHLPSSTKKLQAEPSLLVAKGRTHRGLVQSVQAYSMCRLGLPGGSALKKKAQARGGSWAMGEVWQRRCGGGCSRRSKRRRPAASPWHLALVGAGVWGRIG